MIDARLVEPLRDQQRGDARSRTPLVVGRKVPVVVVRPELVVGRRRHVVPLTAELVIGDDDQRVVSVGPLDDGLYQVDEMIAAVGLAGIAGVLVLGADLMKLTGFSLPLFAAAMNSASSRRWALRAAVPGAKLAK